MDTLSLSFENLVETLKIQKQERFKALTVLAHKLHEAQALLKNSKQKEAEELITVALHECEAIMRMI